VWATGQLPADDAGAAPAAALKALMFADDFTGVAEAEEALQCIISTCYAWSTVRWRMAANNIGPSKSAVAVFAPQFAGPTDHGGLRWGETPLPNNGCLQVHT
jgi:hypothetical protein